MANRLAELDVSKNTDLQDLDVCLNGMTTLILREGTMLFNAYIRGERDTISIILHGQNWDVACCYHDDGGYIMFDRDASFEIVHEGDAVINKTYFPDENFRSYVEQFDTNEDGVLSSWELEAVKEIYVGGFEISNLKGIENFSSLETLFCNDNQLTELDVSQNLSLGGLECRNNHLTELDVSKNTSLWELYCAGNLLTELDVSKNTLLCVLNCHDNQLTELDVSKNTSLYEFDCSDNQLTELDLSKNTSLEWLNCSDNQLMELDVSKNESLSWLNCSGNQLTELDVSNNTSLRLLECQINQLTELDVRKNTELQILHAYGNGMTKLILGEDSTPLEIYTQGTKRTGKESYNDEEWNVDHYELRTGSDYGFSEIWLDQGTSVVAPNTGEWKHDKTGWWYELPDGSYPKNEWLEIDGSWYYFKANGYMAADEWCKGYYFNKDGTWTYKATAKWKQDKKGYWYQDTSGWYPKNQWQKIDGQWYYFKSNGYMASNEYCKGYYFNKNGTWTYKAVASWKKDSKGWYYSDTKGWYAKSCTLTIDGKKYNFNAAGYCTNP